MAESRTEDLLERARQLAAELPSEDVKRRIEFEEALDKLRMLAGRPPRAAEATGLHAEVGRTLLGLDDTVVAPEPRSAGASYRPDFLVRQGPRTLLFEVKAPRFVSRARLRRDVTRMQEALSSYGADGGVLVLPDGPVPFIENADAPVRVTTISKLPELLQQTNTEVGQ